MTLPTHFQPPTPTQSEREKDLVCVSVGVSIIQRGILYRTGIYFNVSLAKVSEVELWN